MRKGWSLAVLGDVAHIKQGKTLALKDMAGGEHPVYGANGVIGRHSAGHYGHPVVALGCRGSCGTVYLAPPGAWLANNVMALWPRDPKLLDLRFLALALEKADLFGTGVISGQVQPQITRSSLEPLKIPLPPRNEQLRIVDLIEAVDAHERASGAVSTQASAARVALESEHFEGGGSEPLTNLIAFASGYPFPDRFQGNASGAIPFFKVSDMNRSGNEVVMTQAANYVDASTLRRMKARAWPEGTVVFPKVGAALLTEKRRLLGREAAFDNNVMGLVPNPRIRPRYLLSFLRTVRLGEFAQQGAVPSINQKHLNELRLEVPPLPEQDEFCDLVESLENVASTSGNLQVAVRQARARLLDDLLGGVGEIPLSYDRFLEVVS